MIKFLYHLLYVLFSVLLELLLYEVTSFNHQPGISVDLQIDTCFKLLTDLLNNDKLLLLYKIVIKFPNYQL